MQTSTTTQFDIDLTFNNCSFPSLAHADFTFCVVPHLSGTDRADPCC